MFGEVFHNFVFCHGFEFLDFVVFDLRQLWPRKLQNPIIRKLDKKHNFEKSQTIRKTA